MSEKIWFIYLTDHHEGPFTAEEVAQKVAQGLVTPQSLGWKDGMAEWLPMETIPELQASLSAAPAASTEPVPSAAQPSALAAGGDESFSLAQLLASQQQGEAAPTQEKTDPGIGAAAAAPQFSAPSSEPGPSEEVWTLRIGTQVSGLHSLARLKALAAEGEVPTDAMLWHPGWTDFRPVATVPEVASARRNRKATSTNVGASAARRPVGFTPAPAGGASVGNDEPTDPGIQAPVARRAGLLAKLSSVFQRGPKAAAAKPAPAKSMKRGGAVGGGGAAKRIAGILGLVVVLGGAAGAYFVFLASPLPSDLDVLPDDMDSMKEVLAAPEPKRLFLAAARGTEDNPADDMNPKFYVATNAPEGTAVTMAVKGKVGTLVNRVKLEKSFNASVGKNQLAVFDQVQDEGKPLPMGLYEITISAAGVEPLVKERFLGGRKGPGYENRLAKYKEKMQADYDAEMQQLSQFVTTLKNAHGELAKKVAEYKAGAGNPGNKGKLVFEWRTFSTQEAPLLADMDAKLKARIAATDPAAFHPKVFQDVATTLAQIQQLIQGHGQRVDGNPPAGVNLDELEGLVQAGTLSLEQLLAQVMMKNPFEVLSAQEGAPNP